MKNGKGPILLFGPPVGYHPWIQNDVELIRNHLQDKYGLVGIVYKQSSFFPASGYPGFGWLNVSLG
jgi:hypothetical protein